eukprot:TRINITY_DN977_c0_g1_i1.p3 TRINITY_DN977_c0_g1~~TRINITY_DN977_c0_g1_i1.p3  ORF type:complete len:130 (-),score=1.44 TRINITY_DN977_c0_g1_i1:1339-1728(-)
MILAAHQRPRCHAIARLLHSQPFPEAIHHVPRRHRGASIISATVVDIARTSNYAVVTASRSVAPLRGTADRGSLSVAASASTSPPPFVAGSCATFAQATLRWEHQTTSATPTTQSEILPPLHKHLYTWP